MPHDLVIRDAVLVDGSGSPGFVGDVAVDDDRITAVRAKEAGGVAQRGSVEVAARGLALAPGFIDVHSHDDFAALLDPELPFKLLQGVTTEVVGNCGMGAVPFGAAMDVLRMFHKGRTLAPWSGFAELFDRYRAEPASANLVVLAGHGTLRSAVAPEARRPLASGERVALCRQLDEALDAGVAGLSTGLVYEPGRHADRAELIELGSLLARAGAVHTTHLRNEAHQLLSAVEEVISVSERTGVSLQLSHHKAYGRTNWGSVEASLARVDAARASGVDVWLDQYPYTASSTLLVSLVARGALVGSEPRPSELLAEDVVISSLAVRPELEGETLAALSRLWGVTPVDAAERVLEHDADAWVVVHAMCEDDVRRVMRHPATLIGSDGIPSERGRPHPRLFGTFPRVLGHYARDEGVLTLPEAIHRMTGLPARRFGLAQRGLLSEGAYADLVLFDPATVADRATFDEPRVAPSGLLGVWVNGRAVVREGSHLGARPGRLLTRAA